MRVGALLMLILASTALAQHPLYSLGGVALGESEAQVRKELGQPSREGPGWLNYSGLVITFVQGKASEIVGSRPLYRGGQQILKTGDLKAQVVSMLGEGRLARQLCGSDPTETRVFPQHKLIVTLNRRSGKVEGFSLGIEPRD